MKDGRFNQNKSYAIGIDLQCTRNIVNIFYLLRHHGTNRKKTLNDISFVQKRGSRQNFPNIRGGRSKTRMRNTHAEIERGTDMIM